MNLSIPKPALEKFLNSISRINEQCILKVEEEQLICLVSSSDNTLILYSTLKCQNQTTRSLHVPDVKKLLRVLDCIPDDVVNLKLNTNNLEYISPETRFKYHLFEDGFLSDPPIKAEKIKSFETDFSFELSKEDYQKIVKASLFASDTNKAYFNMQDGKLFVELTDRARCNTDSYTLQVGKNLQGVLTKPVPVNFDNIKLLNNFTDSVQISINNKFGVLVFDINAEDIKCRYIITSLTQ